MPLGQTITVVNKSGKIVSSSKQLVNVWKEARAAYRERKAEIEANREAVYERKHAERRAQKYLNDDDGVSRASSRRSKHPKSTKRAPTGVAERPAAVRGYTDSYYGDAHEHEPSHNIRRKSVPKNAMFDEPVRDRHTELVRRHTDGDFLAASPHRRHSAPHTSHSRASSIDMDLAYGELPPPVPVRKYNDDTELQGKMSNLTKMLDEANCLQYSVTSMVEHLQKNPDALAAVALTLAEISTLVTKMAPGALLTLKGAFPAAVALLMSPHFLIAGGLAVGVTVVMLGGYKIVKRIKEAQTQQELERPIELEELEAVDLSSIEMWRRGIADAAADSGGSTVDGEFITPAARTQLADEGVLNDAKSTKSRKTKTHRSRAGSTSGHTIKEKKKKKDPSPLKILFNAATHRS